VYWTIHGIWYAQLTGNAIGLLTVKRDANKSYTQQQKIITAIVVFNFLTIAATVAAALIHSYLGEA
jgi:uncharacterized integral membrane protein